MESENARWTLAHTALLLSICGLLAQPVLSPLIMGLITTRLANIGTGLLHAVFIVGPLLGFISVILAHIARRQLRDSTSWRYMAKATAGMIIGYATLAYSASGWIVALLYSYGIKDF